MRIKNFLRQHIKTRQSNTKSRVNLQQGFGYFRRDFCSTGSCSDLNLTDLSIAHFA